MFTKISLFGFFIQFIAGDDYYLSSNDNVYLYNSVENCKSSEYFDVHYIKCRICEPNFNVIPSTDRLGCICNEKISYPSIDYDNILRRPICKLKSNNSKPSIDKINDHIDQCQVKHMNLTILTSTNIKNIQIYRYKNRINCTCNEYKLNYFYQNEYCIPQSLLKDYNQHNFMKTLQQQLNRMTSTSTTNTAGSLAVPANATYVDMNETKDLTFIYSNMKFLQFFCQDIKNYTSCNYLANLCVLEMYVGVNNNVDKNSPCYTFYITQTIDLATRNYLFNQNNLLPNNVNQQNDNSETMGLEDNDKIKPFLYYKKGGKFVNELFDKAIDFSYALDENDVIMNTINLTIMSFKLNGKLFRMRSFNVNDLNLCGKYSSKIKRIKFGENNQDNCELNLENVLADNEDMLFHNLYLDYFENGVRFLKHIPVLIRHYGGGPVEHDDDPENWQLVKRFFIIDTVTGLNQSYRQELYQNVNFYEKFNKLRYVRRVKLRFKIKDGDKNLNRIVIPLLILDYEQINITDYKVKNRKLVANFQFQINFIKNYSFDYLLEILLPIFILLAFTLAIFNTFCYKIRQNKLYYDIELFCNFVADLCSNIATALFIIAVIISLCVFIVYKTQKYVKILLPIREQEVIEVFLFIAFTLKSVKLFRVFWMMSNIDIFFIDWERPKIYDNTQIRTSHLETPSISSSITNKHQNNIDSVSAWRNYFVANEWQELVTKRKVSIFFQIVLVIMIVQIFGIENWSSMNFKLSWTKDSSSPTDIILKVAVGIIVYTGIYIFQRIFNFLIYERYIENPIQQFIDISSLANVSVFILFMESYGFYIHGRSPHGFSDTDMCSMIIQFKREEQNMCGHRGLMNNSEQQTFSILVPRNLRLFYDRLILPLQKSANNQFAGFNQNGVNGSGGVVINGHKNSVEFNFEKTIMAYHNLNRFFGAFIDHALKDLDYTIQEKNILETVLDCELQSFITENKGIFYIDNGHSFSKVLFYGNEITLFQFELLLFLSLILFTNNILLSILIVGVNYKIIRIVMNYLTKNNLAKKTLIDKRFLI